ncbi:Tau-tubulin kinase 1 [Trichinella murrelli]|uniref:Tau-tubulin kinase 1 n=1 Tax=Trichinella murrelli TaxID=144512 RepID=A0A0V0TBM1_9BILA|nr:Tau-tubulin kinase 1 [Trichinella murrelli]
MNLFLLSIYAIFSLSFVHAEEFSENAEGKIEVNISENQSKDFPEMDDQSEKSLEIQDMENADFQEQESVERPDGVAETVKADEDDQQLTTDERQIVAEAPSEKPLSSESEESSDESEELIYSPESHSNKESTKQSTTEEDLIKAVEENEEKHAIEKGSDEKEERKIEEEEVEEKASEENAKNGEHENNDNNDVQEQSELDETFYDALTDTDDVLDLEFHDALCGSSVDPPTDSQEKFPCPTPRPVVGKSGGELYNFLKSKASSIFSAAANFYKIAADYLCIDTGQYSRIMGGEKAANLFSKGDLVEDRWQIIDVLGNGNFGVVYEVYDTKNKINEAMKVEAADRMFHTLKVEAAVLQKANEENCRHTCKVYGIGRKPSYSFIAMTLVGSNLLILMKRIRCGLNEKPTFSIRTSVHVGIEALEAIEDLHRIGFLHRDIKPQNFACGLEPDHRKLYMLDFGMCRNYVRKDGSIRKPRNKVGFRGTFLYASPNALLGMEQSRRDDIWSWYFMLLEITTGTFPWGDFTVTPTRDKHRYASDFGMKKSECCGTAEQMAEGAPEEFIPIADHILSLEYYDAPNYSFLHSCLKNLMDRLKIQPEHVLDWEPESGKLTQVGSAISYSTAVVETEHLNKSKEQ